MILNPGGLPLDQPQLGNQANQWVDGGVNGQEEGEESCLDALFCCFGEEEEEEDSDKEESEQETEN